MERGASMSMAIPLCQEVGTLFRTLENGQKGGGTPPGGGTHPGGDNRRPTYQRNVLFEERVKKKRGWQHTREGTPKRKIYIPLLIKDTFSSKKGSNKIAADGLLPPKTPKNRVFRVFRPPRGGVKKHPFWGVLAMIRHLWSDI